MPPCCLSSTRNTILYFPRYLSPSLAHEYQTHLPKRETFIFKPHPPLPNSSLLLLRLKTNKLTHPFAALSSFAEAEGEDRQEIKAKEHQRDAKTEDENVPGMAQAFHISSRTASAVSVCIAFAALTLPFFMKSLVQGLGLKTKLLSYATLLFGFYMAWNIGANDVANAMGTSVGSGALSLRQAVMMAAVLEFSGALLLGTHVTSTMQKGILVANVFNGKDTLLFAGLLSSLAAAGTWLQVASYYGWPVSTTHCIVGSMVGFGLVYGGTGAVFWSTLARVTFSWVVSPVMGAVVSFLVYKCIRRFVYSAPNPGQAAATAAPIAVFVGVTAISFAAFPLSKSPPLALAQALACGTCGAILVNRIIQRQLGHLLIKFNSTQSQPKDNPIIPNKSIGLLTDIAGPKGTQLEIVYGVFGDMQVLSACFMSFAHGGNDVANAIGPLASALSILQGGTSGAEFSAASVVLFASKLGLPISFKNLTFCSWAVLPILDPIHGLFQHLAASAAMGR